jgi:Anti-sigma factor NepR
MSEGKKKRADSQPGKAESDVRKRRLGPPPDELWLEKNIKSMYREVIEEPIPDELLKILDGVPKRDG